MKEKDYQAKLVRKLEALLPGCVIVKNDAAHVQGIPDLTIFYRDKWAMLEVKLSRGAQVQPNQRHYVDKMNKMSFAAFICPENETEILHELQRSFGLGR